MGYKQVGKTVFVLQVQQQIQNLCLNRDIQCRNGLITDNKLRIQGKGPGNSDTLTLPPGELMGKAVLIARVQPDLLHNTINFLPPFRWCELSVDTQGLRQQTADFLTGIERTVGILEHHLHLSPQVLYFGII